MRGSILLGLIFIAFAGIACDDGGSAPASTATPTAVPPTATPEATATPLPTDTPEPPGSSRDNPVPPGTTVLIPEGWEITVTDYVEDAGRIVQAENPFNDPPEPGQRFVFVRLRAKNVSAGDPPDLGPEHALRLVGAANVARSTEYCGVIPDGFQSLSADVFQGGEVEGNACFQVPEDDTAFVLYTDFIRSDEEDRRWFAVE